MKRFFPILFTLAFAASSFAYQIASFKSINQIDFKKKTRIFVVGYAGNLGSQFLAASLGQAELYSANNPNEQILFFLCPDPAYQNLTRFGIKVVEKNAYDLNGDHLLDRLDKFSAIQSIDVHSHASIHGGINMIANQFWYNLGPYSKNLEKLRDNFSPGAYVTLNGCNTGYRMAPLLSAKWQVPVRGSFTSTDFQKLHNNGNWHFDNPGTFPLGGFKKINDQSYTEARPCSQGRCTRMKPDNVAYSGVYGKYGVAGGLGFHKFFCNYSGGEKDCPAAMAKGIISFPGKEFIGAKPTLEQYRAAVIDFLCPLSAKRPIREECEQNLLRAESDPAHMVYSPYQANSFECDYTGCRVSIKCKTDSSGHEIPGSCIPSASKNQNPTTLIREYRAYLAGFSTL